LSIQVISDKQLVKHLQTEVARLEAELRTPDRAASSEILIMEKDKKIRQVRFLPRTEHLLLAL
jgi:centromeric protein E